MSEQKGKNPKQPPIEQQLDELLSRIEQAQPGTVPGPGQVNRVLDQQVNQVMDGEKKESAPAGTTSGEDLIGSDLANQIQSMLDDAKAQEQTQAQEPVSIANRQKPDAAKTATAQEQADQDAPQRKPTWSQELLDTVAAGGVATPSAKTASRPDEQTLAKIDQMLAESADDAVAGDFETVTEVLAAVQQAAAPATAPVSSAGADEAARRQQQDDDRKIEEAQLPEGDFETFEEVTQASAPVTPAPAASAGATAADVARELDAQPELHPPAAATAPVSRKKRRVIIRKKTVALVGMIVGFSASVWGLYHFAGPLPAALAVLLVAIGWWVWFKQRRLGGSYSDIFLDQVRRLCAVINAPLMRLGPEIRNTIGYVALIQVFLASVILIGKLASVILR